MAMLLHSFFFQLNFLPFYLLCMQGIQNFKTPISSMYLWNFIVKRLHFNWEPFCIKTGYKNFTKSAWHRHTNFKAFPLCFLSIWLLMSFLPNSPPPPPPFFKKINQFVIDCQFLGSWNLLQTVLVNFPKVFYYQLHQIRKGVTYVCGIIVIKPSTKDIWWFKNMS